MVNVRILTGVTAASAAALALPSLAGCSADAATEKGGATRSRTGLGIPANAGPSMKIAFHVKAFLQVPNYHPGEIQNARYAPGQRILLKDLWDNNGGRDYALPIAAAQ